MTIKILLITFIITFVKFINFFLLLVTVLVNKEANAVVYKKKYFNGERFSNFSIKPVSIEKIPENLPIRTLLYQIYWNKVFDLAYFKIRYTKKEIIWMLISKNLIKSLIFLYFYISRVLVYLVLKTVNEEEKSLESFLFKSFINFNDNRIIVMINGEWRLNGKFELFILRTTEILAKRKDLTFTLAEKNTLFDILKREAKNFRELERLSKVYSTKFQKIKIKTPHTVHELFLKDEKKAVYRTEYMKAFTNNNYNLNPIINKFQGKSNETILLEIDKTEFYQISDYRETHIMNEYLGAIKDGYNKELISEKHNVNIEAIDIGRKEIDKIFKNMGVVDESDRTEIFNLFMSSIDDPSLLLDSKTYSIGDPPFNE